MLPGTEVPHAIRQSQEHRSATSSCFGMREVAFPADHWTKRRFQDGDRYCLVASLSVASGSQGYNSANRVERRLTRVLPRSSLDAHRLGTEVLYGAVAPHLFQR